MSLFDQLRRGVTVTPPSIDIILLSNYYTENKIYPLHPPSNIGDRDRNMFIQLHRGMVQPDNEERALDFGRDDRIVTEQHGVKVRLGDKTVNELGNQTKIATNEQKAAILDIQNTIRNASAAQIQAMADVIGTPITDSLQQNKAEVTTWFQELFTEGIEPSAYQQKQIIEILKEIRDSKPVIASSSSTSSSSSAIPIASQPTQPSQPSPVESKGKIYTSDQWIKLDSPSRTKILKDAAQRYLINNIIDQGSDVKLMKGTWEFIHGENKLIPLKEVKALMKANTGYVLNLKDFTITS